MALAKYTLTSLTHNGPDHTLETVEYPHPRLLVLASTGTSSLGVMTR